MNIITTPKLFFTSNNLQTINTIYDAFGKGNIPAIIDCIADNTEWELWADNSAQKAGVPWLQPRKGKQGALEFFKIAGELRIQIFV